MKNSKDILLRNEINEKYKWNIEKIYLSNKNWEEEYNLLSKNLINLNKFKGKLKNSSQNLLDCLKEYEIMSIKIDKLYVYAHMRLHEDNTNSENQIISNKADNLISEFNTLSSFIIPEILEISYKDLKKFLNENNELKLYTHFFENIQRKKNHTFSKKEETIISKLTEMSYTPKKIYTMLNDADIKLSEIENENNEKIKLTKSRYISFLENKSRNIRKNAFKIFHKYYIEHKNTIGAIYYNNIKSSVIISNIRNYSSSLEYYLSDDNIPINVYNNLINIVNENLDSLHYYINLRKNILNLDEIHMYDLYVPLVSDFNFEINFEKSKDIILDALSILGEDYTNILKKAFNNRWIDIYENKGKRGGAYSWGTYSVQPYVLLNYQNDINSTFTLAHEMGHALHSYYSWKSQPYIYSEYKIFVAEVASTCNEIILTNYLMKTAKNIEMKKYILNHFIDQFRGTFFRQTMFAEFEKIVHNNVENGKPLNANNFSEIYRNLNKKYFGNQIIIDNEIDIEWARIPHFYTPYYVYQYATGYSAAIIIAEKILSKEKNALENYKKFLSKGSSQYSIELLKCAGVDITTTTPIENTIKLFRKLIKKLENLFLDK